MTLVRKIGKSGKQRRESLSEREKREKRKEKREKRKSHRRPLLSLPVDAISLLAERLLCHYKIVDCSFGRLHSFNRIRGALVHISYYHIISSLERCWSVKRFP